MPKKPQSSQKNYVLQERDSINIGMDCLDVNPRAQDQSSNV